MHRYRQIEYKAGATIEVIKHIPVWCRKGVLPGQRELGRKTREEINKANMIQAARKLARKINANFKPGDLHVTLTYRKDARPDRQAAQKNLTKFLSGMRREYRRNGFELKYICVTEYKNKAIHHHMIINMVNNGKETTMSYIRRFWKGHGSPKFVQLYDNGEYQKLAEYLIKETEMTFREADSPVKQRYSCSRNLITPKPSYRNRKTKHGWKQEPKPRKGYYIDRDSLYNGYDRMGYPYQRYVMVKLEPTEADWEPAEWTPYAEWLPDEGGD